MISLGGGGLDICRDKKHLIITRGLMFGNMDVKVPVVIKSV